MPAPLLALQVEEGTWGPSEPEVTTAGSVPGPQQVTSANSLDKRGEWETVVSQSFGQEHKLLTPQAVELILHNNYKWSSAFKNHKSLYCTPVTYVILYSYYTSI